MHYLVTIVTIITIDTIATIVTASLTVTINNIISNID